MVLHQVKVIEVKKINQLVVMCMLLLIITLLTEPPRHKITDRLFVNTRYFVIKSNNYDNVNIAKSKVDTFI